MKLAVCAIALSLIASQPASGRGHEGWTTAKAAAEVKGTAVVRIPADVRAALERELDGRVYRWRILEATAGQQDIDDGTIGVTHGLVHNARYRLSSVLKQVRGGLPIQEATCTGMGKRRAGRFGRFRCAVLSARLEIPTPEAVWENDRITGLRYGPPQVLGPFRARLSVRVTGHSSSSSRQLGESSPVTNG